MGTRTEEQEADDKVAEWGLVLAGGQRTLQTAVGGTGFQGGTYPGKPKNRRSSVSSQSYAPHGFLLLGMGMQKKDYAHSSQRKLKPKNAESKKERKTKIQRVKWVGTNMQY